MFYSAQSAFLVISFFIILIMIYLFNSLIQSSIFEAYRVIQITDSFSEESVEMKKKLKGIVIYLSKKLKSLFTRKKK